MVVCNFREVNDIYIERGKIKKKVKKKKKTLGGGGVVCLRRQTPEGGFPAALPDYPARCSRLPRRVPDACGVTATDSLSPAWIKLSV